MSIGVLEIAVKLLKKLNGIGSDYVSTMMGEALRGLSCAKLET
jgi:hypothetical protein